MKQSAEKSSVRTRKLPRSLKTDSDSVMNNRTRFGANGQTDHLSTNIETFFANHDSIDFHSLLSRKAVLESILIFVNYIN